MDLTTSNNTASTKSPEPEPDTPTRIQPPHLGKPLPFTNGVLKRGGLHRHPPTPPPSAAAAVTYRECLKNHAASLGGHALDGCGEFMPSPAATDSDPTSIKCAACGCHRNFHRRDPEDALLPLPAPAPSSTQVIEYQPHHRHHPPPPPPPPPRSPDSASPPPISSSYYGHHHHHHHRHSAAPHVLLALSTAAGPDLGPGQPPLSSAAAALVSPIARKRFRTKFTQAQKERMFEFAERLGWKLQKRDDDVIREFCHEIGVERGVLKVWMHNNKNTLGKRPTSSDNNNNNNSNNDININSNIDADGPEHYDIPTTSSQLMMKSESNGGSHHHHHHNHHHVGTNGSSSSS